MRTQGPGVRGGGPLLPLLVRRGLARLEERGQRRLRVDHDVLAAGQVHDEVGTHAGAVRGGRRRLRGEVDPRQHAGVLDDPTQLDLAPGAAGGGGAQRAGQSRRLRAQRLTGGADGLDLLAEPGVLLQPVALERAHLVLDARQGARERGERRDELSVLGGGGLEIGHPLPQEVALGGQPAEAAPGGGPGGEGAADQPGEQGGEGRKVHARHHASRHRHSLGPWL